MRALADITWAAESHNLLTFYKTYMIIKTAYDTEIYSSFPKQYPLQPSANPSPLMHFQSSTSLPFNTDALKWTSTLRHITHSSTTIHNPGTTQTQHKTILADPYCLVPPGYCSHFDLK